MSTRINPLIHEEVQRLHQQGMRQCELVQRFNLCKTTIRRLLNNPVNWYGLDKETAAKCREARIGLKTAAYIIETYQTVPIAEQAAHLGKTPGAVRHIQYKLSQAGAIVARLSLAARERRKARDGMLVERVRQLAADGMTIDGIAKALRQPEGRIECIVGELGGVQQLRTNVYSLEQVATLFQVTPEVARQWIDQAWLKATRNNKPGSTFAIRRCDLLAFVNVRAAWPSYAPRLIKDEELRERAIAAQASATGKWYSRQEIAQRSGVHLETPRFWDEKGYLAELETTTYGKTIYYWLPNNHPLFTVDTVTLAEAARTLHLSRPTLYKYIQEFGMPVEADGKIDLTKAKAWLKSFERPKLGRPVSQGAR